MSKVIPSLKVKDMPFYDCLKQIPREERERIGLIDSRGHINEYRRAFVIGQGGSAKESTWDKSKHLHTCCKSMVAWRHKARCKKILKKI